MTTGWSAVRETVAQQLTVDDAANAARMVGSCCPTCPGTEGAQTPGIPAIRPPRRGACPPPVLQDNLGPDASPCPARRRRRRTGGRRSLVGRGGDRVSTPTTRRSWPLRPAGPRRPSIVGWRPRGPTNWSPSVWRSRPWSSPTGVPTPGTRWRDGRLRRVRRSRPDRHGRARCTVVAPASRAEPPFRDYCTRRLSDVAISPTGRWVGAAAAIAVPGQHPARDQLGRAGGGCHPGRAASRVPDVTLPCCSTSRTRSRVRSASAARPHAERQG